MGGDDAVGPRAVEGFHHRFGNSAAKGWLGAGAKLVNQHQRALAGEEQKLLHRKQMRRVRTQVVVNGLRVADVEQNLLEQARFRVGPGRQQQAALEHILQEPNGFERY